MLRAVARSRDDEHRRTWALAGLAFGLAAPVAYIAQRLYDHALVGETDPLSMLRQVHVAYFWRAATAGFWGGLAALVVLLVGARRLRVPEPRAAARVLAVVVATFLVLAWIYP
jgi:hypothetical protein